MAIADTGVTARVKVKVDIAWVRLGKLYGFRHLSSAAKKLFDAAHVRPILEYPAVPLVGLSKSCLLKLQIIQNRAVSFIANRDWQNFESMESLHFRIKLEPINQLMHIRAKDIWRRVRSVSPAAFDIYSTQHVMELDRPDHAGFRRTMYCLDAPPPPPIYTK